MLLVGQRESLRLEVRDEQGNLADATVTLTLTRPDGTATSPTVANPSTGVYTAAVTYDQAGDWLRVWQTTGAVVSVDADQVHIAEAALRIVGLVEVKKQLNIDPTDSSQDDELLGYIDAVTPVIEQTTGPVVPRTVTEVYDGGAETLLLRQTPVLAVTSVTQFGVPVTEGAYSLSGGLLYPAAGRWPTGRGTLTVVYRAGRSPIPPAIRLAAKELVQVNFRPQLGGDYSPFDTDSSEEGIPGEVRLGFFVPNRVRDMLAPYDQYAGIG